MKFLFPFFSFLHVFRRQRSETQVVMQLGIDGFQLGFLLFFFPCYSSQVLLRLGNTDLGKWDGFMGWEGSIPLFFACNVFCSAFYLFYYFFMGFFFSIQGAHTRKKESFIHIYPALLIVGSFMVHDVCFFLCIMNGRLGGFFFFFPFSFP